MMLHSPFKHTSLFARSKPRFDIRAQDGVAEVFIYDEISVFGVDAQDFVRQLSEVEAETIHLRINSPGGNVFDGVAIANALRRHEARVVSFVDGIAASIASVIALAGDEVRMAKGSMMMVHDAWGIFIGNAEELRKNAELLEKLDGQIARTYIERTGMDAAEVAQLMNEETWMTDEEAVEMGFADSVISDEKVENSYDLSIFKNAPSELLKPSDELNPRNLEAALRDAGCSRKEAKTIVSNGLESLRDAETPQRDADEPDVTSLLARHREVYRAVLSS